MSCSILHSRELRVNVLHRGAELSSIRTGDGVEYIWQADPAIWARHAPLLFPIIGKLKNGCYSFLGNTYELGQHGFARDQQFVMIDGSSSRVVLELRSTKELRAVYPFDFVLRCSFSVTGAKLVKRNEVFNTGETVLPFSIGEHPGFSCAWQAGDQLDDYYLEFESDERLDRRLLKNGLLSCETAPCLRGDRILRLTNDTFKEDAIVLRAFRSAHVSLCRTGTDRRLLMGIKGFPWLGLWAKPGEPFVCIEPWFGHADPEDSIGELVTKPGVILLEPGRRHVSEYTLDVIT